MKPFQRTKLHKTVNLAFVFCGLETRSLTLGEKTDTEDVSPNGSEQIILTQEIGGNNGMEKNS
jgi:hypothetical protein